MRIWGTWVLQKIKILKEDVNKVFIEIENDIQRGMNSKNVKEGMHQEVHSLKKTVFQVIKSMEQEIQEGRISW